MFVSPSPKTMDLRAQRVLMNVRVSMRPNFMGGLTWCKWGPPRYQQFQWRRLSKFPMNSCEVYHSMYIQYYTSSLHVQYIDIYIYVIDIYTHICDIYIYIHNVFLCCNSLSCCLLILHFLCRYSFCKRNRVTWGTCQECFVVADFGASGAHSLKPTKMTIPQVESWNWTKVHPK